MHLGVYAANLGFIFAALVLLAGCGWSVVAPFRDRLRYPLLVAPMAGLLCGLLATLILYVQAKLPLATAGTCAGAVLLVASGVTFFLDRPDVGLRQVGIFLAVAIVVGGLSVACVMQSTVREGGPALVYVDGTDHVGYATMADWLNGHRITELPVVDPARPYESWPALIFQIDPRFGSYALLALVSAISGASGVFSYDLAAALVQVVAVLAVAGVFARSPWSLLLLLAGLFTSHWFDYGRTGFFGKNFGYPATFTTVGLLLLALGDAQFRISRLIVLAVLVTAAAFAHSGTVTGLFIGVMGGAYLLAQAGRERRENRHDWWRELIPKAGVVGLLAMTAILASGTIARPMIASYPDWGVTWDYCWLRIAELESQGVGISGLSAGMLHALLWLMLGVWVWLGALALRWRQLTASAVLVAPLGLLVILRGLNANAVTFQLIGTFYPLGLAGAALLFDTGRERQPNARKTAWLVLGLAVVILGFHQFRFRGALGRYGGGQTPPAALYTQKEIEGLAAFVGREPAELEVTAVQPLLMLLAELGRRETALQWSRASWQMVLGYRKGWVPPAYPGPGKWRIVSAGAPGVAEEQVVFRSAHYWVLKR